MGKRKSSPCSILVEGFHSSALRMPMQILSRVSYTPPKWRRYEKRKSRKARWRGKDVPSVAVDVGVVHARLELDLQSQLARSRTSRRPCGSADALCGSRDRDTRAAHTVLYGDRVRAHRLTEGALKG